jgi:hypothetical protein
VKDWNNSTGLLGVEVLVGVPGGSGRTSLTFSITNYGNSDVIRLVHNGTVGNGQTVTELTTLVDRTWGLGVDLTVSECCDIKSAVPTWEGNPPGDEKALTKASIPSADMGYSL